MSGAKGLGKERSWQGELTCCQDGVTRGLLQGIPPTPLSAAAAATPTLRAVLWSPERKEYQGRGCLILEQGERFSVILEAHARGRAL